MKRLLMIAALGAMTAMATPAMAQGMRPSHERMQHDRMSHDDRGDRGDRRDRYDRDDRGDRGHRGGWDSHRAAYSGDGRGYWHNGQYYRDGKMYGRGCPRGLAKRNNGCFPPAYGRARWNVGQRLPDQYRNSYVPSAYRDRYSNGTYRYYNGYVYRVDPKTYAIQQVIGALLR